MFDIGFPELVLVAIVGLLVIGPERLPDALRTLGLWLGRMRRSFVTVKNEIEKEIGMDEVRRQLHNEAVMEEMKRIENEVRDTVADANPRAASKRTPTPPAAQVDATPGESTPGESTPGESTPGESTPGESTPGESAAAQSPDPEPGDRPDNQAKHG